MATNSDLNNKNNAVNVGEMIAKNKQKKFFLTKSKSYSCLLHIDRIHFCSYDNRNCYYIIIGSN